MAAEQRTYPRGTDEFSRVLAFSDGLFAISMTLLVVGIDIPDLNDADSVRELANALNDDVASFTSFVISFLVVGRYWRAHHASFSRLAAMNDRLIEINLLYLLFIAFLPFPTGLLGNYFENPLSVAVYAVVVAIVSGMEVVMFSYAQRHGLLNVSVPAAVYRWGTMLSLSPVMFFIVSIPVAFVNTTVAVVLWFGTIPFGLFVARYKPEGADEFF